MGVPVFDAPCEAEAQCAELAKAGKVFATATEDMDALTFRTPKLLRKMTFAASGKGQKQTVVEIDLEKVLQGLRLSYEEFVDLCILCGCDYCSTIKGIGPKTALKLIREHKSIENIIRVLSRDKKHQIPADWRETRVRLGGDENSKENTENNGDKEPTALDQTADTSEEHGAVSGDLEDEMAERLDEEEDLGAQAADGVPEADAAPVVAEEAVKGEEGVDFEVVPPMFVQARALFLQAEAHPADSVELKWSEPDEEGLKRFLVTTHGFNEERVENGIKRLKAAAQTTAQRRVDSFFTVISAPMDEAKKRKLEAAKAAAAADKNKKKAKAGPAFAKKR